MSLLDGQVVSTARRPARQASAARSIRAPSAMSALRVLTWLPVGALLALLLLSVIVPADARRAALPIAIVGALIGLPHGAVDHLVPLWWGSAAFRTPGKLLAFIGCYGVFALAAFGLFLLLPTPMLVGFLVLSAAHFGRGEVVTAAERAGRPVPSAREEWPATAAFGIAVVGLLLWAHPASTDPYLRPVSPWLADHTMASRQVGLLMVGLVVSWGAAALARAGRVLELAELALLVVALWVCPPLAAFGVYFGLWHAVRHTGRLLDLARSAPSSAPDPDWRVLLGRVARASSVPTAAALCAITLLWWGRAFAGLQSEVAVLLALTFPHTAVVWALDRRAAALSPRLPGRLPGARASLWRR